MLTTRMVRQNLKLYLEVFVEVTIQDWIGAGAHNTWNKEMLIV